MIQHVAAPTTKTALHAREPDCWRGGRLIPLHKGKSARSEPTGYRSIFVSNFVTKLYHSVLRDHLVEVWHKPISQVVVKVAALTRRICWCSNISNLHMLADDRRRLVCGL